MMKKTTFLILFVCASVFAFAQDWAGVSVPVNPPSGSWQLASVSDDFNYSSSAGNRPAAFNNRWKDSFVNAWTGPDITVWNSGRIWHDGKHLAVQAHWSGGKVYAGCMSSKQAYKYPLYIESRVKFAGCFLANNLWMINMAQTQEIDVHEVYTNIQAGQEWFDQRIHLSHHVFIRDPFQDYQPKDDGSWYTTGSSWRGKWVRVGVYWKDPWHLEYYIDGRKVRTVSGKSMIDPNNYTKGAGLSDAQHIVINMEQQSWMTAAGRKPTTADLQDANNRNIMWVDWVRVYTASGSSGGSGGGDTGGGDTGGGSSTWTQVPGAAKYVSVDNSGQAWVVNSNGQLYLRNAANTYWSYIKGAVQDVGAAGRVSVTLTNDQIQQKNTNNNNFTTINGAAEEVDVDASGNTWVVNSSGKIYTRVGSYWVARPGTAKDIGCGADGSVYIIASNRAVQKWNGSGWSNFAGGAGDRIDVDYSGNPWVVSNGKLWRYSNGWSSQRTGVNDVGCGSNGSVWICQTNNQIFYLQGGLKSAAPIEESFPEKAIELSLYPNPTTQMLNVVLDGTVHQDAQLMIYSSTGSLVRTESIYANELQLNTGNLANGIYILKVINGGKVTSKTFIKN